LCPFWKEPLIIPFIILKPHPHGRRGVLDALFDFGAIVSNTPLQSASAFVKEEALKAAQEGGASSVVVVELTYPLIAEVKTSLRAVPSVIRFSLYSTESGAMLRQLQYTPPSPARNMEEDKKQAIEQTLRLFADQ